MPSKKCNVCEKSVQKNETFTKCCIDKCNFGAHTECVPKYMAIFECDHHKTCLACKTRDEEPMLICSEVTCCQGWHVSCVNKYCDEYQTEDQRIDDEQYKTLLNSTDPWYCPYCWEEHEDQDEDQDEDKETPTPIRQSPRFQAPPPASKATTPKKHTKKH